MFLSLDSTVLYYPVYHWVHEHLIQGKLPLICDLAYNGAPVAAVSMAGVLSPVLWLFHGVSSEVVLMNLLFIAPFVFFIFGTYFLARRLGFSPTAGILLAFLWTYNGHRMAQLDHWNVAWACAFFPWAFWSLVRCGTEKRIFWVLLAGFFWGLNLLSGHPQVFFLEGLFFVFWTLLAPSPMALQEKAKAFGAIILGACLTAAPLLLFVRENLFGDDSSFQWDSFDRFFHSWTPLNFITLLFPWFFGRDSFDRQGSDYWWQYQFVEMQVAFSVIGLFFILLFFFRKNPQRRWISVTALFGLSMALGKFFLVYPLVQSLPLFSFFRDPSRYWFLVTWTLGLGAAAAWDQWFEKEDSHPAGKKLALGLSALSLLFIGIGWFFLTLGRPLLDSTASWLIRHFLLGDPLHQQPLSIYMDRLSEKWQALALNLNPRQPRVFLPLLFLAGLTATVWNRKKWNLNFQKGFLLALVFLDLMIFRMPLGNCFYKPSDIPAPQVPAPQNRSLTLLYKNVSPLPDQYGEMAYPNMNLVSNRPNLVIDANPPLPGYGKILADLGWFSWVYKDRDPLGFTRHLDLLWVLGVDQIVTDIPLTLPDPFRTIQDHYPYVYALPGTYPKAYLTLSTWTPKPSGKKRTPPTVPAILNWGETRISLLAPMNRPGNLFLQKTFLPGWKAFVNGREAPLFLCDQVLMGVALDGAQNRVELKYDPSSLRLGFFLFFLYSGLLTFAFFRRLLA